MSEIILENDLAPYRLLNAREAAYLLNVSVPEVYKLLQSKKLTVIQIGRSVRVRRDDLLGFIEANRKAAC